jgi:hypothetical protein
MIPQNYHSHIDLDILRRQVRLIVLLDAAENAGLIKVSVLQLHTFAYFSNVLSSVWDLSPLDGKLLKRRGSPFYPNLQHNLDQLVGIGVVMISNISYVLDEETHWRIEGSYSLNRVFADPIIQRIKSFEEEEKTYKFIQELAYALSSLSEDDLKQVSTQDATYSDPVIDAGNVIDFAEWENVNYSANAAHYFEHLIAGGGRATRGEMLHLYVRHLHRRLHAKP